jgi:succinate dehydrogenase / fumarate reductase cytochrome b subunit
MNTVVLSKSAWAWPSIMVKAAMAVSGLGLALWVTLHMVGNMLWFAGPAIYNGYAQKLRETGVLWPVRTLLLTGLAVHVLGAVFTTQRARRARPVSYKQHRPLTRWAALASHSMRWTGVLLVGFLGCHVATVYGVGHPAFVPTDPHRNLTQLLQHPLHALPLWAAAIIIALHLSHGLGSAWITLGVKAERRERLVRRVLGGWTLAVAIGFGLPLVASAAAAANQTATASQAAPMPPNHPAAVSGRRAQPSRSSPPVLVGAD